MKHLMLAILLLASTGCNPQQQATTTPLPTATLPPVTNVSPPTTPPATDTPVICNLEVWERQYDHLLEVASAGLLATHDTLSDVLLRLEDIRMNLLETDNCIELSRATAQLTEAWKNAVMIFVTKKTNESLKEGLDEYVLPAQDVVRDSYNGLGGDWEAMIRRVRGE